jgi:hypothetical protein
MAVAGNPYAELFGEALEVRDLLGYPGDRYDKVLEALDETTGP